MGCVARFGGVVPVSGRTKPVFSTGLELHVPLQQPGDGFTPMVACSYEEFASFVEHAAGLSRGNIRVQSAGMEFRAMFLLPAWKRREFKVASDPGLTPEEIEKLPAQYEWAST